MNVLTGMNFFEMVRLGFNKKWDVVPLSDIYPPGVSHEQMEQEQAAEMNQSELSLIHISEPTRRLMASRMPSSA